MINTKLIILDRDGVINLDSDNYIKSPAEWEPIAGSLTAISRLNQSGYSVVVATNQSGISRCFFDCDTLNAIHDKMVKALAVAGGHLDAIFFCPHTAEMNCKCRKPLPGMINEITDRFNVPPSKNIWVVGDSLRDLQAAANAHCQPVLVKTGKGEKTILDGNLPEETIIYDDLSTAIDDLLLREESQTSTIFN